jgi:hypothetical protein
MVRACSTVPTNFFKGWALIATDPARAGEGPATGLRRYALRISGQATAPCDCAAYSCHPPVVPPRCGAFPAGLGLRRLGRGARAQLTREAVLIRGQGWDPATVLGRRLRPPAIPPRAACARPRACARPASYSHRSCVQILKKEQGRGESGE